MRGAFVDQGGLFSYLCAENLIRVDGVNESPKLAQ